jgi:hypothetical protein
MTEQIDIQATPRSHAHPEERFSNDQPPPAPLLCSDVDAQAERSKAVNPIKSSASSASRREPLTSSTASEVIPGH